MKLLYLVFYFSFKIADFKSHINNKFHNNSNNQKLINFIHILFLIIFKIFQLRIGINLYGNENNKNGISHFQNGNNQFQYRVNRFKNGIIINFKFRLFPLKFHCG